MEGVPYGRKLSWHGTFGDREGLRLNNQLVVRSYMKLHHRPNNVFDYGSLGDGYTMEFSTCYLQQGFRFRQGALAAKGFSPQPAAQHHSPLLLYGLCLPTTHQIAALLLLEYAFELILSDGVYSIPV